MEIFNLKSQSLLKILLFYKNNYERHYILNCLLTSEKNEAIKQNDELTNFLVKREIKIKDLVLYYFCII